MYFNKMYFEEFNLRHLLIKSPRKNARENDFVSFVQWKKKKKKKNLITFRVCCLFVLPYEERDDSKRKGRRVLSVASRA